MPPIRLRHAKGVSTIDVNSNSTVQDLQQEIYTETQISPSRQIRLSLFLHPIPIPIHRFSSQIRLSTTHTYHRSRASFALTRLAARRSDHRQRSTQSRYPNTIIPHNPPTSTCTYTTPTVTIRAGPCGSWRKFSHSQSKSRPALSLSGYHSLKTLGCTWWQLMPVLFRSPCIWTNPIKSVGHAKKYPSKNVIRPVRIWSIFTQL